MPDNKRGLCVRVPSQHASLEESSDVWVNICCEEVQFALQEVRAPVPHASESSAPQNWPSPSAAMLHALGQSMTGVHRNLPDSDFIPPEPGAPLRQMITDSDTSSYAAVAKANVPPTLAQEVYARYQRQNALIQVGRPPIMKAPPGHGPPRKALPVVRPEAKVIMIKAAQMLTSKAVPRKAPPPELTASESSAASGTRTKAASKAHPPVLKAKAATSDAAVMSSAAIANQALDPTATSVPQPLML